MQKQIHFLCSQQKANLIGTLNNAEHETVGADIVLHVKGKNGDGIDLMDDLLHAVCAQSKSDTPVVGHIAKEVLQCNEDTPVVGHIAKEVLQCNEAVLIGVSSPKVALSAYNP